MVKDDFWRGFEKILQEKSKPTFQMSVYRSAIYTDEAIKILKNQFKQMIKSKEFLRRLVIFSILMEANEGIVSKSPKYILETFNLVMTVPYPENLLDFSNKAKLDEWLRIRGEKNE